tara:strand:+ start:123 stop:254 length:132 start_codon:yes stop_codon:yes gene_type:complete
MIYVANDVLAKNVEEVKGLMSIFFDLDLDHDSEVILLEENLVH